MTQPSVTVLSWNTQSCAIAADAAFPLPPLTTQLVVVGTQEDRKPGSYLHSHVLPREMAPLGYTLAGRTRFMGVGKTSYKSLYYGDLFARGCRISCYVRRDMPRLDPEVSIGSYSCSYLTRNKGAVSLTVALPGFAPVCFVCCHLPFAASSLRPGVARAASYLSYSNYTLNTIIETLRAPDGATYVFGDMNYRATGVSAAEMAHCISLDPNYGLMAEELDELRDQLRRGNLPGMREGIGGGGPSFAPTAKLKQGRAPGQLWYRTGKQDQRCPSWSDRVLSAGAPDCVSYERFENQHTVLSDHAAVVAMYS